MRRLSSPTPRLNGWSQKRFILAWRARLGAVKMDEKLEFVRGSELLCSSSLEHQTALFGGGFIAASYPSNSSSSSLNMKGCTASSGRQSIPKHPQQSRGILKSGNGDTKTMGSWQMADSRCKSYPSLVDHCWRMVQIQQSTAMHVAGRLLLVNGSKRRIPNDGIRFVPSLCFKVVVIYARGPFSFLFDSLILLKRVQN